MRINTVTKLSLMNFFLHLFFLSPIIVFFFEQKGLNYFDILALESILILGILIFELPTGIFADRFGRKKSIIIGTIFLGLEPIIFLFANSFNWFILSFICAGIGITFHSGSIEALIYDHLKSKKKEKDMKKVMGNFGSATLLAMAIAPIIGSYLAKDLLTTQFNTLLIMTIGAMIIGIAISLFIKDTKENKRKKENPITIIKEGIQHIRKNKLLLRIILLSVFANPFLFTLTYLYQPYFQASTIPIALFGTIFSIALLLAAIIQKYAYKYEEKIGMKWAMLLATIIPGICYIIMAFIFHPLAAIALFIVLRVAAGVQEPLFSDYKNIQIPSKNRATILSLISMIIGFYLIIIRLIIGKLANIDISYAFILMGIIILLGSILFQIKTDTNNQLIRKTI